MCGSRSRAAPRTRSCATNLMLRHRRHPIRSECERRSVNMDHVGRFEVLISEMKADGRYRTFVELERMAGQFPAALLRGRDGRSRRITVWCSNDYLGMGQHPDVLAAMHDAIDRSGAGTGGTRNISGTNWQHVQLETELADLHSKEGALIFTSGWISNLAALGTLGRLMPG